MSAMGYTTFGGPHTLSNIARRREVETYPLFLEVIGIGQKASVLTILDLRHGMLLLLITDTGRHRLGIWRYTLRLTGLLIHFVLQP